MARRSFQRSPRGLSTRRQTSWFRGPENAAGTQLTSSGATLLGNGATATEDGLTLVRTRGILTFMLTAATAASDGFHGAFGLAIVTTPAFQAGVASLPSPVTEIDWDGWLYHQFFKAQAPSAFTANGTGPWVYQFQIDSKAMRKVADNESFILVAEVVEVGTAALAINADSRMLFKLP